MLPQTQLFRQPFQIFPLGAVACQQEQGIRTGFPDKIHHPDGHGLVLIWQQFPDAQ